MAKYYLVKTVDIFLIYGVCICSRIVLGLHEHLMAKALFFIVFVFVIVFAAEEYGGLHESLMVEAPPSLLNLLFCPTFHGQITSL